MECLLQEKEHAEQRTAELEQTLLNNGQQQRVVEFDTEGAIPENPSQQLQTFSPTGGDSGLATKERDQTCTLEIDAETKIVAESNQMAPEDMVMAVQNAERAAAEAREDVKLLRSELERVREAGEASSSQR